MSRRFSSLLALVTGALCAALLAAPAAAAPTGVQAEIDAVIAQHGGKQISATEVSWNGGAVVLSVVMPHGVSAAAVEGCADGAYCFYQHQNFGGRKLTFRDCTVAGLRQNLYDYGFDNMTTSWVANKSLRLVDVFHGTNTRLWQERAHAKSSNVGTADNDKADWFRCYL